MSNRENSEKLVKATIMNNEVIFNGRNHDIPFMLINQRQGCQKIDIQMLIHI